MKRLDRSVSLETDVTEVVLWYEELAALCDLAHSAEGQLGGAVMIEVTDDNGDSYSLKSIEEVKELHTKELRAFSVVLPCEVSIRAGRNGVCVWTSTDDLAHRGFFESARAVAKTHRRILTRFLFRNPTAPAIVYALCWIAAARVSNTTMADSLRLASVFPALWAFLALVSSLSSAGTVRIYPVSRKDRPSFFRRRGEEIVSGSITRFVPGLALAFFLWFLKWLFTLLSTLLSAGL